MREKKIAKERKRLYSGELVFNSNQIITEREREQAQNKLYTKYI